jgi:cyclophilin family peptidyl-prolyl cis-trans isomerase
MRRSRILMQGAKNLGWYQQFKTNPEAYERYTTPTPFDWSKPEIKRPKAYFDILSGTEAWGRLVFELAQDVLPKTVENFSLLTTGQNKHNRSFKGTKLHRVRKGEAIMGGDVEFNTGEGSHSAYDQRYILDENWIIPHSDRGLLSMASIGVNTNGSQFYISFSATKYMNGRCSVFGRLVEGDELLNRIEKVYTHMYVPSNDIIISDCGML